MHAFNTVVATAVALASTAYHISLVSAGPVDNNLLSRNPFPQAAPALAAVPTACPGVPAISFPFQVASGWAATKVAGNLTLPRGIVVDTQGRLLMVQNGIGISQHILTSGGCIQSSRVLIAQTNLNHGIYLSPNGTTLYASSPTTVWSWTYDPASGNVLGSYTVLVTGMVNSGHITRTLIIPPHAPNLLLVAHGSNGNVDAAAVNPATARAVVRVFDLSNLPSGGYNYVTQGYLMGYGLRNEVALAFDGNNMPGSLPGDDFQRTVNGVTTDIHQDNPAEELNYLGDVTVPNNNWYGYPVCYTVWQPSLITDRVFAPGDQFVAAPNSTFNDTTCIQQSQPAHMIFQSHNAPIDSKFDATFSNLFITLHGSWDRQPAAGFRLVSVPFAQNSAGAYVPTAATNSTSGWQDILYQADPSNCSGTTCIRPAGLAFVAGGNLYMTSDNQREGELFLVGRVG
ncbi:uncharacterized protein PAC_06330 [Phialocephala subalpina]|uniref:Pyrroloquinoline quinone-dependent pyranose dehydrogenase beta-propeller domain-containing protein n=1 Tax=Phialocephala subalpina TaxID=576137 RepID=A0A1L7WUI8_9HELO|nr:uncharacterized protein PAC_06330 [Phialocephala subalpina]